MVYAADISRSNPACVLFVIDQSGSMDEKLDSSSKADQVASILNRTLAELIIRCSREEGVRDYFDVGVIGYGHTGPSNALSGPLSSRLIHSLSAIEASPLRVEDRMKKMSDGAGGLIEVPSKFPVWFSAKADGGTPMCDALTLAAGVLVDWCDAHPDSFPPVVIHLTDGGSTDGDPEPISNQVRQISTNDGQVILMNVYVSAKGARSIAFPETDESLNDPFAELLFRMSSTLVASMARAAIDLGYQDATEKSRAFMFNAKTEDIVSFFEIGTRPSNLR